MVVSSMNDILVLCDQSLTFITDKLFGEFISLNVFCTWTAFSKCHRCPQMWTPGAREILSQQAFGWRNLKWWWWRRSETDVGSKVCCGLNEGWLNKSKDSMDVEHRAGPRGAGWIFELNGHSKDTYWCTVLPVRPRDLTGTTSIYPCSWFRPHLARGFPGVWRVTLKAGDQDEFCLEVPGEAWIM